MTDGSTETESSRYSRIDTHELSDTRAVCATLHSFQPAGIPALSGAWKQGPTPNEETMCS